MIRLIVLLFLLSSSTVVAQQVTVRSGEHEGFSRLVFTVPEQIEWSLGRAGDGYELRFEQETLEFDLSDIFERIPRTRLADVRLAENNGAIGLEIACNCHAEAFLFGPTQLVLDVIDGPAVASSEFEEQINGETEITAIVSPILDSVFPIVFGVETLTEPSKEMSLEDEPITASAGMTSISDTQNAILNSIARGSAQGLINVAPSAVFDQPLMAESTVAGEVMQFPLNLNTMPSNVSVRAQTSVDASMPRTLEEPVGVSGEACLDANLFAIASWGNERPFGEQIAEWRGQLYGEFDVEVANASLQLSRTYIHFGFGLEALRVLEQPNIRSQDRDALRAIAAIIDGLPVDSELLRGQIECVSPVALWAILSAPAIPRGVDIDLTQIRFSFFQLPQHLRDHLAPKLAQRLANAGYTDVAEMILNNSKQPDENSQTAMTELRAEIDLEQGNLDDALVQLAELAREDSRISPSAVIELIDLSISQRGMVTRDVLELADLMAFELRTDPVARSLIEAQIRGLITNRSFDAARELVETHETGQMTELVLEISEFAGDTDFLRMAYTLTPDAITGAAQNKVATRLIELGFTNAAADYLKEPRMGVDAADQRYLRAEIAAGLGEVMETDSLLASISSDRANEIRRTAYSAANEFTVQALTYVLEQQVTQAAWRAGAWNRLQLQDEDNLLRAAARAMTDNNSDITVAESLQARRELLAESSEVRTLAEQLLVRFSY